MDLLLIVIILLLVFSVFGGLFIHPLVWLVLIVCLVLFLFRRGSYL